MADATGRFGKNRTQRSDARLWAIEIVLCEIAKLSSRQMCHHHVQATHYSGGNSGTVNSLHRYAEDAVANDGYVGNDNPFGMMMAYSGKGSRPAGWCGNLEPL